MPQMCDAGAKVTKGKLIREPTAPPSEPVKGCELPRCMAGGTLMSTALENSSVAGALNRARVPVLLRIRQDRIDRLPGANTAQRCPKEDLDGSLTIP